MPHTKGPGFRPGRDGQAHLDLGQDGNDGDAETENEVEADEDLALVAGAGLGVVDEEQGHSRDRQRIEEEGEEGEAWAGGRQAGESGGTGTPAPSEGLSGRAPVVGLGFLVQGMMSVSPKLPSFTNTCVSFCPILN